MVTWKRSSLLCAIIDSYPAREATSRRMKGWQPVITSTPATYYGFGHTLFLINRHYFHFHLLVFGHFWIVCYLIIVLSADPTMIWAILLFFTIFLMLTFLFHSIWFFHRILQSYHEACVISWVHRATQLYLEALCWTFRTKSSSGWTGLMTTC